ncbi:MAG: sulfatase-like hydrolase/transferase [Polyangiaceae bacterium]
MNFKKGAILGLAPTALAVAIDVVLRARTLSGYALQGKAIYASSLLVSAGFWGLPLWGVSRLAAGDLRSRRRRVALVLVLALWVLPFATFCYGGQVVYHRVFDSYMGRDTLRLGIALRGTVRDWFGALGGPWLGSGMLATGVIVTWGLFLLAREAAVRSSTAVPLALVATFAGSIVCFWTDNVDSRFLQAATPDACFAHGVVHALRMAVTGQWARRQGVSLRTPAPLPPLTSARARPPNVLLVLGESIRADATCSDPPPRCKSPMLDDVVPDRMSLGVLTAQTPNTFSASVLLWTGVVPNADFRDAHTAPTLWELARAVGYRTAYLSSQNPEYEDFGTFTRVAGIDVNITAIDLGGMEQEQLGAPDERAVDAALRFVRETPTTTPYFAVLHLSNTHAPYRVDPALLPFVPQSPDPLGDVKAFHNRYRDSVRLVERTLADLLRAMRGLPTWDDTAVVFLSDHGEEFREHGGLYHNHSLYEEGVRVPGWLVAGRNAVGDLQRLSLATHGGHRTYTEDVHETVVDLFGLEEERASLPLAGLVTGRSLLRPRGEDPPMLLATSTAVWEPDDARYGVMLGNRVLFGGPTGSWSCFDLSVDPGERSPHPAGQCGDLLEVAKRSFALPR